MSNTTKYDIFSQIEGKGVHIMETGYGEVPEASIWLYGIDDLNNANLDFRSAKLKKVAERISVTETGESMQWYEDDLKQSKVAITGKLGDTIYEVDTTSIRTGNILLNSSTQKTYTVVAVAGNQITISSADTNSGNGDVLVRLGSVKKYGGEGNVTERNALSDYTNYFEYVQEDIPSDMITNNRTRLFIKDANELAASAFSDASRNIIKGFASRFYFGKKEKIATGGSFIYQAGGLNEFVPLSNRVNIKGADDSTTKRNLEDQLIGAYASGLKGIFGNNKLIWFCNTKFKQELNRLYEDKLVLNDTLKRIEINIDRLDLIGRNMYLIESGLLNEALTDLPIAYGVPVDHVFGYMVPNTVVNTGGKTVDKLGRGLVFALPQTAPEKRDIALFTSYSFQFEGIGSGAYRILTIA